MSNDLESLVSSVCKQLIIHEGVKELPYYDTEGWITTGIGFLHDPRRLDSAKMPKEVALLWLRIIVEERVKVLQKDIPFWDELNNVRKQALLNMSYQLGVAGLLKFKKTLRLLAEGKFHEVEAEAKDSDWYQQTPGRATEVINMLVTGKV